MIESFHFLRPAWFLAVAPLALMLWMLWQSSSVSRSWRSVIDPKLLPYLLAGNESQSLRWPLLAGAFAGLMAITALAGPVWEKLPQPVFTRQAALVIALDLSASMDANDVKPSRIARARLKIADILGLRDEGQTALVVYAADAFAVTPLTEDNKTINALLPGLGTDMMPAQGSRADKAYSLALELLENAGVNSGDILFVSDGVTRSELNAIQETRGERSSHRISVLAVGTEAGAPVPLNNGGFLKDNQGAIVIARLAASELRELADNHGGEFRMITAGDDDIESLLAVFQDRILGADAGVTDLQVGIWREQGPWLLLLLLPLVALVFRRGVLFVLALLLVPYAPPSKALGWNDLWQNTNQQANREFEQGEHARAAELFSQPDWKASSYYRAGDYQKALEYWQAGDSESALYNKGNALAKLGKLEQAIDAYRQVLEKNPAHEDALHNKKLLEEALQQQEKQQNQGSDQDQNNQQDQQNNQDEQNNQEGQGQDQSQSAQSSDSKSKAQQDSKPDQQSQSEAAQQAAQAQLDEQSSAQQQAESTRDDNKSATGQQESMLSVEDQLSEQAAEQWLRKIPDDPGELLRRKFLYQYRQRGDTSTEQNPW